MRIRVASWEEDRERLLALRTRVFVDEQGVPAELEDDGDDPGCLHLAAEEGAAGQGTGTLIGTCRLRPDGKIGRMAVDRAHRGRGVGQALLARVVAAARERGLVPWLSAQRSAVSFYEGLGFAPEGDEHVEAGIPHRLMRWTASPPTGGDGSARP